MYGQRPGPHFGNATPLVRDQLPSVSLLHNIITLVVFENSLENWWGRRPKCLSSVCQEMVHTGYLLLWFLSHAFIIPLHVVGDGQLPSRLSSHASRYLKSGMLEIESVTRSTLRDCEARMIQYGIQAASLQQETFRGTKGHCGMHMTWRER